MNERQQDWEWLREFARKGDQSAFAAVVRRHLDLVYATALRKLEDAGGAEEVAQNVFAALARKAWQFAPDDSLPAWLHKTTLLEAKTWLRGELRRRRREQTAAQLGTTMNISDQEPALRALIPLLDEGLLSLREKDRTALLLRYYESRPLREVGAALGVSEDAARKRVGAALELLSGFFRRRGFQTATVAATTAALQHTAAAAPATVATAISQSALHAVPPALASLTSFLSRLTSLTKTQAAALSLALVAVPVGWQWHQSQQSRQRAAAAQQTLEETRRREQQLDSRLQQLRSESARLTGVLAEMDQARARQEAAAGKLQDFKQRIFGLLTATNYRWPDDLPFIRIPKSDLKELRPNRAIDHEAKIGDWGAELLGLTPEEKQKVEEALRAHAEAVGQSAAARAYPTNYLPPTLASHWTGKPYQSIWVAPLASDAPPLMDDLRGRVSQTLGDERAQILLGEAGKSGFTQWSGACGDTQKGALLTVCVDPANHDGLECGEYWDGGGGSGVSPNTNEVRLAFIPDAVARQFFDPWLEQMGITNTITRSKP